MARTRQGGSAPALAFATGCLPFALPFALLVAAWWPSRRARFGIIDDHQIIAMLDGHARLPLRRVLPELYEHRTESLGRFRPLYWVGQVLESAIAGDRPLWWYVDRLGLAAITLAAVLYVCRQFTGPWVAAVLAPTVLLGPQFEAWARLGAAEVYAMPFLAVGVAGLVRGVRRDETTPMLWGAAALVASGLAKESFLPFAVAGIAFMAFTSRGRRTHGVRWLLAALTVVVLADFVMVAHQLNRYGSQYAQERTPTAIASWAAYVAQSTVVFQAFGTALLVLVLYGRRRVRPGDRTVLLALVGAVAVEVAFYAGADQVGRYLLPTTLCTLGVWLVALRALPDRAAGHGRAIWITSVGTLAISLALGSALAFLDAQANAAATRRFQARLHATEAMIRSRDIGTVVLEPADPYLDTEDVLSLAQYLHGDLQVTVMTTPSRPGGDLRDQSIAASLAKISAKGGWSGLISPLAPAPDCLSLTFNQRPPVCTLARPAPR